MMSYDEVVEDFVENILPVVCNAYERDGIVDSVARNEAWNDFTDGLREDGLIDEDAYNTWELPRRVGRVRCRAMTIQ